jgi:diadenosine tetraphosphatase ApaH/serine/threonine PP2A family protein phosphatase
MRLALLSDIHSNLEAMQACLARARLHGATQFAILGDLVGYGPDPSGVVNLAMAMATEGAWVLKGNHDELAVSPPVQATTRDEMGARWTHDQLDQTQRDFLLRLPLHHSAPPCYLVHASADAPERWRYVNNPIVARESLQYAAREAGVCYVLGGHVHQQALYYRGAANHLMLFEPTPGVPIPVPKHRQWIATVGSAGQPRDGNPAAAFALLDTDKALLTFYRVPYDVGAVIAEAKRKGMPEEAISRLESAR